MSIEKLIETLTAAVVDLNATLKAANLGVPAETASQTGLTKQPDPETGALGKRKAGEKGVVAGSAKATPSASTSNGESGSSAPTAALSPEMRATADAPAMTKEAVKAKVVKVIGTKGKDIALALIKGFGATHLDNVKVEDYAELAAKCDQVLAGDLP
jgi:hypothetical protein